MNQEYLMQVLQAPHVSEKTTASIATADNQHVFKVLKNASKADVKKAVELMFSVKVSSVRLLTVKAKTKRFNQGVGHRKDWKKAYVRLEQGHTINLEGGE